MQFVKNIISLAFSLFSLPWIILPFSSKYSYKKLFHNVMKHLLCDKKGLCILSAGKSGVCGFLRAFPCGQSVPETISLMPTSGSHRDQRSVRDDRHQWVCVQNGRTSASFSHGKQQVPHSISEKGSSLVCVYGVCPRMDTDGNNRKVL